MNDIKTVYDLQEKMRNFSDVGVAIVIQNAISAAIRDGEISSNDALNFENLENIRQKIFKKQDSQKQEILFAALLSGKNVVDEALNMIEGFQQQEI